MLTDRDIYRRSEIILSTDKDECQRCGRRLGHDVAADPHWYIDNEAGDVVIFCPACW